MVSPVNIPSKPVSPQCAALARAFERAKGEHLVCFPTATPGTWECKTYTLTERGPRPQDVTCTCVAGQRGLVCKHAVCVIFARKHGVRPLRPAPAPFVPVPSTFTPLVNDPLAAVFA